MADSGRPRKTPMTDQPPNSPEVDGGGSRDRADDRKWIGVPPWFVMAAGAVLIATLAIVVVLLLRDDDTVVETVDSTTTSIADSSTTTVEPTTTLGSTTSSEATSSTSQPTTSTSELSSTSTEPGSTTTAVPSEFATAVWPWFTSATRYTDPAAAAQGFAEDFVGFEDPVVGEFQQGDSRSGEVEVRPVPDGPVTTVLVRQLGDDGTWWVLGSVTENIVVEEPLVPCFIESPLTVKGESLTLEGNVEVQVRADDMAEPLVITPLSGGDTELLPFEGEIVFASPLAGSGSVVFLSRNAADGGVWEASVVRVSFIPGGC